MTQPTGYCQFNKCKAPLFNGKEYCNTRCRNCARSQRFNARQRNKPAKAKSSACTCVLPSYGVCIKHLNEKRRATYKANKKYYPGSKLGIPSASFPRR